MFVLVVTRGFAAKNSPADPKSTFPISQHYSGDVFKLLTGDGSIMTLFFDKFLIDGIDQWAAKKGSKPRLLFGVAPLLLVLHYKYCIWSTF